jgi:hypothetical protein
VKIVKNRAANAGTIALMIPFTSSVKAFPLETFSIPRISTSIFLQEGPPIPPEKPKKTDKIPIEIKGEISKFTKIAINNKDEASKTLVINKINFLEYLSASLPPIGDEKGCKSIGIELNNPTIKDESVFSRTYQFTKINLKKNVEKARAPDSKCIEKKIFL